MFFGPTIKTRTITNIKPKDVDITKVLFKPFPGNVDAL